MYTRALRTLAIGSLVVATALVGGTSVGASGATSPKIVVTPATSLHNNEAVHVSGTGFKPHDSVYITECLATAKGEAGCDINVVVPATINAKGVLAKTTFNVATGTIGNGKCGTTAANLRKCAVSVGNASGGDSATFVVTFALPKKK